MQKTILELVEVHDDGFTVKDAQGNVTVLTCVHHGGGKILELKQDGDDLNSQAVSALLKLASIIRTSGVKVSA